MKRAGFAGQKCFGVIIAKRHLRLSFAITAYGRQVMQIQRRRKAVVDDRQCEGAALYIYTGENEQIAQVVTYHILNGHGHRFPGAVLKQAGVDRKAKRLRIRKAEHFVLPVLHGIDLAVLFPVIVLERKRSQRISGKLF